MYNLKQTELTEKVLIPATVCLSHCSQASLFELPYKHILSACKSCPLDSNWLPTDRDHNYKTVRVICKLTVPLKD